MICGYHVMMCRAGDSKMRSYGQVFWWLIVGSVGSEGVEMCQADVINCRGTRPTRWVAGGVRPTRWVVESVRRTPGNKHQDLEVVREKVKGWSTPGGCGEIHDGIER